MTRDAQSVVQEIQSTFEPHRDPDRAEAMAAYMRGLFPFLGIASPERTRLEREALLGMPKLSQIDLEAVALALWAMPEREYQYAACGLLALHAKALSADFLPTAKQLVQTKSWWDTVDTLAAHLVGAIAVRDPEARTAMDAWIEDDDFWVARVAILHQLRAKSATDAVRLFRYCELRAGDSEFFIRKAIGWALREYSKTDAAAVRSFVAAHEETLSGLSKREALLWLNGGRKGNGRGLPVPGT